jgi:hypothetical protein
MQVPTFFDRAYGIFKLTYKPAEENFPNLELMRLLNEKFLDHPTKGVFGVELDAARHTRKAKSSGQKQAGEKAPLNCLP